MPLPSFAVIREWKPDDGALLPGVPEHLRYDLRNWLVPFLRRRDMLRLIARRVRLNLHHDDDWAAREVLDLASDNPERFLDVIGFVLSRMKQSVSASFEIAAHLETLLVEGGSAWQVVEHEDTFALADRVDAVQFQQITQAASGADPSSIHLRNAWVAAYGRQPDGTKAYDEAVKAVEAAIKTTVSPENPRFSLGTAIRDMNAAPHKWTVIPVDPAASDAVEPFVRLCQWLWRPHERHGDPSDVAQHSTEEGRAAVHLAISLVSLARSGAFRLR